MWRKVKPADKPDEVGYAFANILVRTEGMVGGSVRHRRCYVLSSDTSALSRSEHSAATNTGPEIASTIPPPLTTSRTAGRSYATAASGKSCLAACPNTATGFRLICMEPRLHRTRADRHVTASSPQKRTFGGCFRNAKSGRGTRTCYPNRLLTRSRRISRGRTSSR